MTQHEAVKQKIVDLDTLMARLGERAGERVVFTNGCFDIVHRGHAEYLSRARDLGDLLIVGLNNDASVRGLKGETRPIVDEESRALLLASMQFVDYVVLFDEATPLKLIERIGPDVLVKGGDYNKESIVGYDAVTHRGGEVVVLDFVEGFSTTRIIEKIKSIL